MVQKFKRKLTHANLLWNVIVRFFIHQVENYAS